MTQLKKFDKKEKRLVKKLFVSAFPPDERPPFILLYRKMNKPYVDCFSIYNNNEWCGFTYVVTYNRIAYVFFLAIDDKKRGNGIGSQALEELKKIYSDKSLLLAIEEVDDSYDNYAQRLSRKSFYNRNGFEYFGYKIREGSVTYDALSTSPDINPNDYRRLFERYAGKLLAKKLNTVMYKE